MFRLQNILNPEESVCTVEELYYHRKDDEYIYNGYFNVFSAGDWVRCTQLKEVSLVLHCVGAAQVSLYADGRVLSVRDLEHTGEYEETIPLPPLTDASFYYFSYRPAEAGAVLKSGYYATFQKPARKVHIAADICTFHREQFVQRNLTVLKKAILENPDSPLNGHFDVYVIDNGQSLNREDLPSDAVHLYPNINAGGTGGFTRGILEILKDRKKSGYTHIIFLDDDAVLEPDAFLRTYALLSFVREEYEKACISGMLMDLNRPWQLNESGAILDGFRMKPLGSGIDLRKENSVCECRSLPDSDYAGWWYACYPIGVIREDNLPVPFFIHFDDIEYGLRSEGRVIRFAGISVWHEGQDRRNSQSMLYYDIRNGLVTNALRRAGGDWKNLRDYCCTAILYDSMRYMYESGDLIWNAVRDFFAGPAGFARIAPVEKNQEIRQMTTQYTPIGELELSAEQKRRAEEFARSAARGERPDRLVSTRQYAMTLNGWILPARRSERRACLSVFSPDARELYRAEKAVLIDPYSYRGALVKKDYRRMLQNIIRCVRIRILFRFRYDGAQKAYRKYEKRMTCKAFWMKYLELENH